MKMRIVTYNFRTWGGSYGDGINNFLHRCGVIFETIHREMPDIIGFQEIMPRPYEYLVRMLPEYTFVGQFRDADFLGEGTYIAVRKDRFQILGFNTFWLSPTPYVPGSRFEEQSDCPRICNVARIRHIESNFVFRVFNTHLDHVGEGARVLGMKCILDEMMRLNNVARFPAILMGDMNARPSDEAIRMCNAFEDCPLTDVTAEIPCTFHHFGRCTDCKIDYIFVTDEFKDKVTGVGIWEDQINGSYLSDHYPVWMDIEIEA